MSSDILPEKVAGDSPFESETEIEEQTTEGGITIHGSLHQPVWGQYCEDDLGGMIVRGYHFMSDKKKIPCGPPLYKLMHADIFKTKKDEPRAEHFAANKASWAYQRWERMQAAAAGAAASSDATSSSSSSSSSDSSSPSSPSRPPSRNSHTATSSLAHDPLSPLIIINFLIPGSGFNMNLVLYFARRIKPAHLLRKEKEGRAANGTKERVAKQPANDKSSIPAHEYEQEDYPHDVDRIAAFDGLLKKFLEGSDEFRDCRLKIVPRVADGPWLVKKSIGRVPAILGKKMKQIYYRDVERNYLEIDADLGSSMVAGRIISMVKGTCKGMVVDMSFLLQGEDFSELPESLLGGIRMIHIDLDRITFLDENNEKNPPEFDF